MAKDTRPPGGLKRREDDREMLAHNESVPVDLRDAIIGPEEELRPAVALDSDIGDGVGLTRRGYTAEVATGDRRPLRATPAGTPTITRDPTLSRAVDAEAAGVDLRAIGFGDTDGEAGHPGPIEPTAGDQSADAGGEPAGKWGSSGSPTS